MVAPLLLHIANCLLKAPDKSCLLGRAEFGALNPATVLTDTLLVQLGTRKALGENAFDAPLHAGSLVRVK
jgi:hypothetical protein